MQQSAPPQPAPDNERLKIIVDAWKQVVSVQMHFNDMEMKIRTLYFSVLAAAIGAVGLVQGKRVEAPYFLVDISLAMIVLLSVAPVSLLFYFIDRHWYHRLLQGAVKQGADIENRYGSLLPEIQLGVKLSQESPLVLSHWVWKWLFFYVGEKNFRTNSQLHSDAKIEILYKSVIFWVLIAVLIDAFFVNGIQIQKHPIIFWVVVVIKSAVNWLSQLF